MEVRMTSNAVPHWRTHRRQVAANAPSQNGSPRRFAPRDDADLENFFCVKSAFFRQALMPVALTYSAPSKTPPQHSHAHARSHAQPSANSQFPCAWRRCASPPARTSGPWAGRISFRWGGSKRQAPGPWVRLPWCALAGNVRLHEGG